MYMYTLHMYVFNNIHNTDNAQSIYIYACFVHTLAVPEGNILTYNSSSGTDGSHIIEHEVLH